MISLYTYLQNRIQSDSEQGATAVEYGMLVALIAAVIVGIVLTLGQDIKTAFETVANKI